MSQRLTVFKALLQLVPPADKSTGLRLRGQKEEIHTKPIEPVDKSRYSIVKAPTWHVGDPSNTTKYVNTNII